MQLLCGLFEVLTQESLLRLQSVTDAVTHVLLKLSLTHDLALDEAGRYHGLYRLMGHPSSEVRALVGGCPATSHMFYLMTHIGPRCSMLKFCDLQYLHHSSLTVIVQNNCSAVTTCFDTVRVML